MIDLRALREDPDRFRASQRVRGESESLVDDLLAADEQRRAAVARFEVLRAEQKQLGKQVAKAQGEEKQRLLARTKELAQQVKAAELAGTQADAALRAAHGRTGELSRTDPAHVAMAAAGFGARIVHTWPPRRSRQDRVPRLRARLGRSG